MAVVWTGLEILKGWIITGLPWAGLGHSQWQNLPLIQISSIVGMYGVTFLVALINEPGQEIIIAEARYARDERNNFGDLGFFVDEKYQGMGLAQYLYSMLLRLAKERGLKGFTAEVLQENTGMIKVFEKGGLPVEALLKDGVYKLRIPFD